MASKTPGAPSDGASEASAWRRFMAWIAAIEEAMDTSYDEIQDRRILALEREVASLKAILEPASGSNASAVLDPGRRLNN